METLAEKLAALIQEHGIVAVFDTLGKGAACAVAIAEGTDGRAERILRDLETNVDTVVLTVVQIEHETSDVGDRVQESFCEGLVSIPEEN